MDLVQALVKGTSERFDALERKIDGTAAVGAGAMSREVLARIDSRLVRIEVMGGATVALVVAVLVKMLAT